MTETDDLTPPSESVWTKYSPNHEFPLSTAISIVLHGLVVAVVLSFGFALNARWHGEAMRPPNLDVGFVAAPTGYGLAPGGGSPPGGAPNQTENTSPKEVVKNVFDATRSPNLDPIAPMPPEFQPFDLPTIGDPAKTPDLKKAFDKLETSVRPFADPKRAIGPPGGQGGGGVGPGKGPGTGPGTGIGGIPGGATRAEILAQRWRFNPTGSPRDHVQKLFAAGIVVGFKDSNDQFFRITDLRERPVKFQPEPFDKYKDTVKWFSQEPRSVLGMSDELRMPGSPQCFILLLPKDREQKLADAEFQFAKARNRDTKKIEETWFDFRPVGGAFEPVVIGQVPFEPRPKW